MSAAISATLFNLLYALLYIDPFNEHISLGHSFLQSYFYSLMGYMIYSMPVILTYGLLASLISDWIASKISTKASNLSIEWLISLCLHLLFGLVLLHISLIAAILFFIIDRILRRYSFSSKPKYALASLLLPAALFGITLVAINYIFV